MNEQLIYEMHELKGVVESALKYPYTSQLDLKRILNRVEALIEDLRGDKYE